MDPSVLAPRPASVEAYLPISSLMTLTYLCKTGEASRVHPAGLVIFSISLVSALLVRRGFCSWVCPVGALSEYAHKAGRKLLGRNLALPAWFDRPLRGLKYALLAFFLYTILRMPIEGLRQFIQGPYNRIADVKMYLFFAHISMTALSILLLLTAASVFIKNFWCRYLCPYGALVGVLSWVSPMGIWRTEGKCTQCKCCDHACPNSIKVSAKKFVWSEECTACFSCVQACPAEGAVRFATRDGRITLPEKAYAFVVLLAFVFVPLFFSAIGYWETETPPPMYKALYRTTDQIDYP